MKNLQKLMLVGGVLAFSFAAVPATEASTIRFVDTYTPTSPVTLAGQGATFSFSHDLTLPSASTNVLETYVDGGLVAGDDYDPLTDTLTSGTLSLTFGSFSTSPAGTNGTFDLFLGASQLLDNTNFQTSIAGIVFDVALISNDGLLTVTITRANAAGSVTFTGSVLDVNGTRGSTLPVGDPVPEPASMILLGSGLAALAFNRYRRRRAA